MNNVVCLRSFRSKSRKNYLAKYGAKIDGFIADFVQSHLVIDFRAMASLYQDGRRECSEAAWDYIDFREILREAIEVALGQTLMAELKKQRWFDPRYINYDSVMERCVSAYIIEQCEYAIIS